MKNYIVLTPFSFKSVILYHQLKNTELCDRLWGWFDSNPKIWGEKYDDLYIGEAYFSCNIDIIVCSEAENIENEIVNKFKGLGYQDNDFLKYEEVEQISKISKFEAAEFIDEKKYMQLRPEKWNLMDSIDGISKIKKMRMWNSLQKKLTNEGEIASLDEFEGYSRIEFCKDAHGEIHIILKRFEIDVTNRCSLKCKNCTALMQYYKNPTDVMTEVIIRDYNRMIELIEWTDDVLIMGGEPFIHKELDKVVEAVLNNPHTERKVGVVKIVTNGTIVPNEKILQLLSGSNVVVAISNYSENSRKIDELIREFQKYNIKFFVQHSPTWKYVEQLCKVDNVLSDEELYEMRQECSTRNRVISNGKFYLCSFLKSAHALKAVPRTEDGYVDLYGKNVKEQIANHLDKNRPFPVACSWCNGNSRKHWNDDKFTIPVAEQIKEPLDYVKYD